MAKSKLSLMIVLLVAVVIRFWIYLVVSRNPLSTRWSPVPAPPSFP